MQDVKRGVVRLGVMTLLFMLYFFASAYFNGNIVIFVEYLCVILLLYFMHCLGKLYNTDSIYFVHWQKFMVRILLYNALLFLCAISIVASFVDF